jgi:plasmid maintenance system antidote protein VapI
MTIECPHCNGKISVVLKKTISRPLKGRELLKSYIEESGKKIKVIAKEAKITPGHISNMKNGRISIGAKRAISFAEYFDHPNWRDFLVKRLKK